MPYIADGVYYINTRSHHRASRFPVPMNIMQQSNVVIQANFKIIKNRFGPHTDAYFSQMAYDYVVSQQKRPVIRYEWDYDKDRYQENHFNDNLFTVE
jgi:hypothetical protein